MTEESAADLGSAPEAIVEAPEGETEGQVTNPPAEGEKPEDEGKSKSAKRLERRKAEVAGLRELTSDARARAERAEQEADRLREEIKALKRPTEQEYPDPLDYTAENAGVSAERRLLEREAKNAGAVAEAAKREAEELSQRERGVVAQEWTAQVADAKTRYADFETVALSPDVPVTKAMGDIIMTSDDGPGVLYHLGQNRGLAAQIARMNPVEAARAIGRIEATLAIPKARTETNAPAPINPVRGSAGASVNPDKISMEDWVAGRRSGKIR